MNEDPRRSDFLASICCCASVSKSIGSYFLNFEPDNLAPPKSQLRSSVFSNSQYSRIESTNKDFCKLDKKKYESDKLLSLKRHPCITLPEKLFLENSSIKPKLALKR